MTQKKKAIIKELKAMRKDLREYGQDTGLCPIEKNNVLALIASLILTFISSFTLNYLAAPLLFTIGFSGALCGASLFGLKRKFVREPMLKALNKNFREVEILDRLSLFGAYYEDLKYQIKELKRCKDWVVLKSIEDDGFIDYQKQVIKDFKELPLIEFKKKNIRQENEAVCIDKETESEIEAIFRSEPKVKSIQEKETEKINNLIESSNIGTVLEGLKENKDTTIIVSERVKNKKSKKVNLEKKDLLKKDKKDLLNKDKNLKSGEEKED